MLEHWANMLANMLPTCCQHAANMLGPKYLAKFGEKAHILAPFAFVCTMKKEFWSIFGEKRSNSNKEMSILYG